MLDIINLVLNIACQRRNAISIIISNTGSSSDKMYCNNHEAKNRPPCAIDVFCFVGGEHAFNMFKSITYYQLSLMKKRNEGGKMDDNREER